MLKVLHEYDEWVFESQEVYAAELKALFENKLRKCNSSFTQKWPKWKVCKMDWVLLGIPTIQEYCKRAGVKLILWWKPLTFVWHCWRRFEKKSVCPHLWHYMASNTLNVTTIFIRKIVCQLDQFFFRLFFYYSLFMMAKRRNGKLCQ